VKRIGAALILGALVLSLAPHLLLFAARAEAPDAGVARGEQKDEKDAPYLPRESANANRAPRDFKVQVARGAKVVHVPIRGTIDLGLTAYVTRVLKEHADAAAIVFDINTLGGRVDAAIQIRDALLDSKVKTVAFVHPRAISAGALISLACDVIAVGQGASIGAATPIQMGEDGAKPVEEKMVSYFRTEMRTTAEAKKRRGDIAEAMVDASVEIPGISPAGKLLTLDNEGALKWAIADLAAKDMATLLKQLGFEAPRLVEVEENWAEHVVRFLTDPVVSGLLMSLGTLGILIELYTPGLGLPGALGVLCLLSFFGGHLLVNLAGLEELILFVVGLGLLAVEVFALPGFGVAGIAGLLCVFTSLTLTLIGLPLDVAFRTGAWVEPMSRVGLALIFTLLLALVAFRFLPRTRAGRQLVLESATTRGTGFTSAPDQSSLLGKVGLAQTDLRPAGVARLGDQRVDVVTDGSYVSAGTRIRVIEVAGMRVVVRAEIDDVLPQS
jgi:membrane-bound serine protease (ClpP class)